MSRQRLFTAATLLAAALATGCVATASDGYGYGYGYGGYDNHGYPAGTTYYTNGGAYYGSGSDRYYDRDHGRSYDNRDRDRAERERDRQARERDNRSRNPAYQRGAECARYRDQVNRGLDTINVPDHPERC